MEVSKLIEIVFISVVSKTALSLLPHFSELQTQVRDWNMLEKHYQVSEPQKRSGSFAGWGEVSLLKITLGNISLVSLLETHNKINILKPCKFTPN